MPNTKNEVTKKPNKNRILVFAAAVLMIAVLIFGTFYFGKLKAEKNTTETSAATTAEQTAAIPTTEPQPAKGINPLTGLSDLNASAYGKRPVAVVVENSPPARPQWGLCSPDILIEGVVEGGITRMLWLYADVTSIPKVGPVRSARHDFVEMAEGLNAIFIHWGGSSIAYDALAKRNVDDVDGMNGKYFFRDSSRNVDSEHTGYTTGESIAKAINDMKFVTQLNTAYSEPFKFTAADKPFTPSGGTCQSVAFEFSSSYKHEFKLNPKDKLYYNYMNSKPMVEDGGKQMAVTNVIVLYCPVSSLDSAGHMEMNLTGGTGIFISNENYENITWKKGTPNDMLKLYSSDGSELTLNAGKSYIGFVPTSQESSTVVS